jgi:hypothetical protein
MFKGVLIGLFIISLVAMLATEVNAGCYNIGGESVCADWYVGSETCSVTVATKAITSKSSTTSLDCGQNGCDVTCKVSGTAQVRTEHEKTSKDGTTHSGGKFCEPGDDDCGILGFVFCQSSTNGEEIDREPLTLTEANVDLPLRAEDTITGKDCVSSGSGVAVCHTSIEVDPKKNSCHDCCKNPEFPKFKTFTAQAFFGEVTVCPSNSESAECFSVIERCLVDSEAIRSGQSAAYFCNREPSEIFRSRWP